MESSPLKIEHRDTLYFKKYIYKATVILPNLRSIIYDYKQKLLLDKPNFYEINKKFLDWRDSHLGKLTIRVEGRNTSIFSNDIEILKSVEQVTEIQEIYQAVISPIPGVKLFKTEPKHKYRIYFKSKVVLREFIHDVVDMIEKYENTSCRLYPSNTFKYWLTRNSHLGQRYLYSGYFIDFDEEKMITFLQFRLGENIRSIYKLEKRPEA